jgi:hypothetical protein
MSWQWLHLLRKKTTEARQAPGTSDQVNSGQPVQSESYVRATIAYSTDSCQESVTESPDEGPKTRNSIRLLFRMDDNSTSIIDS